MEMNDEIMKVADSIQETTDTVEDECNRVREDSATATHSEAKSQNVFCVRCGAEIALGQLYCPKCGQKVGEKITESNPKGAVSNAKKKIGIIVGSAAAIIAVVIIILAVRGVQAKGITLNKKDISVKVGETASLTYTINPTDTKDKNVAWESSNDTIAQVTNGTITGVNEGECEITVSTKSKKTDMCIVTVLPAGPDLLGLYNDFCSDSYATIATDGSYLNIDTNPSDKDDYMDYAAYIAITSINEALELPESVLNRMNQTRSMDGIQTYSTDDLDISWTYHPNRGLEVNYTLK